MIIKYLYALFIGILFAVFIGIGISTFYPGPTLPDQRPVPYPEKADPDATRSAEMIKAEEENRKMYDEFNKKSKEYNRNVSIIALVFAVIALFVSLTLIKNLQIISDGLLLGGIFTLIYSIGRGIEAEDTKFRFAVVTIGFIISLIIGYIKFVKPMSKEKNTA
jgi:hypothetical protein